MNSLQRFTAAIAGESRNPPVVLPYLEMYFPGIVDRVTPFRQEDLQNGSADIKTEALSLLHTYFDCDWVQVTTDPQWPVRLRREVAAGPFAPPIPAERMLEEGMFTIASKLTRLFGREKFVYGRVGVPYGALFGDFSDIGGALVSLKSDPDRCKRIIEASIPRRLEEIRAWAEVGVHGLWLGEWLCSADVISEKDYLEFVYPYDQAIVEAVHAAGMKTIYHFCGHVTPRVKHIRQMHPTILGVEESKKGFLVDIGEVRRELGDCTCLLGNIDTWGVLECGSPEAWVMEVERQIMSGGPERFIIACGSPITATTPPEVVREFVQVAKAVRDTCR